MSKYYNSSNNNKIKYIIKFDNINSTQQFQVKNKI